MPWKLRTKKRPNKSRETAVEIKDSNKIQKTKHACIMEVHESTRKLLESNLPNDHEDHIAETGFNSSSGQEREKLIKVASVAIGQSKEQKGGRSGSTNIRKEQSMLPH